MLKKDLAKIISDRFGLTVKDSMEVIDGVFDEILKAARKGDPYQHAGFGRFEIVERKKRRTHNVATGEIVELPAKKVLRLAPSRRLNKALSATRSKSRNSKNK